ncbi:MAG: response regulator transcription factor [Bacteroidales bacterium]|nr:response regulator transcription factor [Bacteroidales bacterium]
MTRVITIDDEPLALRLLEVYISRIQDLELVASCRSASAAAPYMNAVDAVFLDINMPDLSGMDFARSLENPPLIVFTTAYSEFAVEGFKVSAVDYLLKPFSFEEFSAAVAKIRERLEQRRAADMVRSSRESLYFKADYQNVKVEVQRLVYAESMGAYVKLHMLGETRPLIILHSLKGLLDLLPGMQFLRIHKSYIINTAFIESATHSSVRMRGGINLTVGESYRASFCEALDI